MLKRIWENKHLIVQGILGALFSSSRLKAKARARRIICDGCPHSSKNTSERPEGNLPYEHCTQCGCMLLLKTHSEDSSCPINKW